MKLALVLILLHTVDGSQIELNPEEIITMRPRHTGENFAKGAECMINTADGKFTAVRETCEVVLQLINRGAK